MPKPAVLKFAIRFDANPAYLFQFIEHTFRFGFHLSLDSNPKSVALAPIATRNGVYRFSANWMQKAKDATITIPLEHAFIPKKLNS